MYVREILLGCLLISLLVAFPASAQNASATVIGKIDHPTGDSGGDKMMEVMITSESLEKPRVTSSSSDGRFFMTGLRPGTYSVQAKCGEEESPPVSVTLERGRIVEVELEFDDEISLSAPPEPIETPSTVVVGDTKMVFGHDYATAVRLFAGEGGASTDALQVFDYTGKELKKRRVSFQRQIAAIAKTNG